MGAFAVAALAAVVIALTVFPGNHFNDAAAAKAMPSGAVSATQRSHVAENYAALPLAFERNQGQTDAQVKYMARGNGYTLFLTPSDAVFSLSSRRAGRNTAMQRTSDVLTKNSASRRAEKDASAVVRMKLVGSNAGAQIAASGELPGKSNYYLGKDPTKWQTGVAHYARVSYADVYPGVNLAFHGAQRQVEFDFVVAPGANPAPIALQFSGDRGMKTDDAGNLVIASGAGDVLVHKPVAYQEKNGTQQLVDARFTLKANNQVAFELGNYDHGRELVIDPSVTYGYSTYLGGTAEDDGNAIAFDVSNGIANHAYVTGATASSPFPGATGVTGPGGAGDVFVTEFSADGTTLIYSTVIGGNNLDIGNGIAVDSNGNAYVVGGTESSDFPTTTGAYQPSLVLHATQNAFILKLSATTGTLAYSTFLGGSTADTALGIALDSSGDVYAVGQTSSANFPSKNALQTTAAGGFLVKLTPAGNEASDLVFSTYLGAGSGDTANAVALDSSGNAYVTGQTVSASFHTTTGVVQTKFGGVSDAFVTAIKGDDSAYIYSTYLGGADIDIGDSIAVDASGNAYVTGETASTNSSTPPFPTTSGAFQTTYGGGSYDSFVTKLNSTGSTLVYSSYLGGGAVDNGRSIAIDGSGNAYVTGQTFSSTVFPITSNATQPTFATSAASQAFVTEVNPAGSQLVFSTYLGGAVDQDAGSFGTNGGIAVDGAGATIYVTGSTDSSNFPVTTTPAPFQPANGGGTGTIDAFVVKYDQAAFSIAATTPAAVAPETSATSTITLTSYNNYATGVTLSCSVSGSGTPLPACSASSFSPASPITPLASPGAQTTLTVTTTGPNGALFHPTKFFYALGLPIVGLSLVGVSFSSARSRRRKLLGFVMILMVVVALLLMPACGGSSSSGGGGGGGNGGTPAGTYNVTVTGTDGANHTQAVVFPLTVN